MQGKKKREIDWQLKCCFNLFNLIFILVYLYIVNRNTLDDAVIERRRNKRKQNRIRISTIQTIARNCESAKRAIIGRATTLAKGANVV